MNKTIERALHTIDASGKTPGRLATEIVRLLIGKHRAAYMPNVDGGDHVQVINASKMQITGKKLDQKVYHRHTTFAQGLRTTTMKTLWSRDPSDVLRRAVSRMLPKNKLRTQRMKRLLVKN